MQENTQQSNIVRLIKKAWPTINRIINSIIYFILSVIKSIVKGMINQLKGKM